MASFPTSVKVFTSRNTGDTIQASHVNDLQDEVNGIEDGYLNATARLNSSNATVAALQVTNNSTFSGGIQSSNSTITVLNVTGTSTLVGNVVVNGALQSSFTTVNRLTLTDSAPAAPGATVLYSNRVLHTWAVLSSTPTLLANVNVSSATRPSSGVVDIAFGTALGSTNYAVVVTPRTGLNGVTVGILAQATTGFQMRMVDGTTTALDIVPVSLMVIGG